MCAFLRVPRCSTDRQPRTGSALPPATAASRHLGSPGEPAAPLGARTQHIPGRWHVCGPLVHTPALNLVPLPGSQLSRSFPAAPAVLMGEWSGQSCGSHSPRGRRMGIISALTPIPKCPVRAEDVPIAGNLWAAGLCVRPSSTTSHRETLWLCPTIRRAGVLWQMVKMVPL